MTLEFWDKAVFGGLERDKGKCVRYWDIEISALPAGGAGKKMGNLYAWIKTENFMDCQ